MQNISQTKYKLSATCPEYARDLREKDRFMLLSLQGSYCRRFDYSQQGTMYPSVEIMVEDGEMGNLVRVFNEAFGQEQISETTMTKIKRENKGFATGKKYKKHTWNMDKKDAKGFFSIFDESIIQPKLEKVWVHLTKQMSFFRSLTDEEIKQIYHSKEPISRQAFDKVESEMLRGTGDLATCTWRRIEVLFGRHPNRNLLYTMKLEYFENVNPCTEEGILKLSFNYQTYSNGKPLGILVTDKIAIKKNELERQKKREREEQEEKKKDKHQRTEEPQKKKLVYGFLDPETDQEEIELMRRMHDYIGYH